MATRTAGFEVAGATNGQVIATTDAGDSDSWDTVSIGGLATAAYETGTVYNGAKSGKFATAATSTTVNCRWTAAGKWAAISDHYGRAYIFIPTSWNTAWEIMRFLNASAVVCSLQVDATKHLAVKDSAGTVQASAATAFAGNVWARIEWHIVHSATVGSITVNVFVGANIEGTVPDYSVTATNINTGTQADEFRIGITAAAPNAGPVYYDAVVGHATSAVGPLVTATKAPPFQSRARRALLTR